MNGLEKLSAVWTGKDLSNDYRIASKIEDPEARRKYLIDAIKQKANEEYSSPFSTVLPMSLLGFGLGSGVSSAILESAAKGRHISRNKAMLSLLLGPLGFALGTAGGTAMGVMDRKKIDKARILASYADDPEKFKEMLEAQPSYRKAMGL